jgi:hypothetical protein
VSWQVDQYLQVVLGVTEARVAENRVGAAQSRSTFRRRHLVEHGYCSLCDGVALSCTLGNTRTLVDTGNLNTRQVVC